MSFSVDIRSQVEITIDGVAGTIQYSDLVVEQPLHSHHTFSFIWKLDMETVFASADRESLAHQILGSAAEIRFNQAQFKYVVSRTSLVSRGVSGYDLMVFGVSPTILMDDMAQNQLYIDEKLDAVFTAAVANVPGDFLGTDFAPTNKEVHPYLVQYNETDFQFLRRLCARYGEFMFYDGKNLRIGEPLSGGPMLTQGKDLRAISITSSVNSQQFAFSSYDPLKGSPDDDKATGISAPGGNTHLTTAVDKGKELFRKPADKKAFANHTTDPGQLTAFKELKEKSAIAKSVVVSGESINPDLRVGLIFSVNLGHDTGEYVITSITHHSETQGRYINSFEAIPASNEVPPYTNPEVYPAGQSQSAVVMDNNDPEGMGRIKVAFHWNPAQETPWLRLVSPHGGGDKGFYFIPEVGEEVQIGFDNFNAEKPYVVGTLYHGKAKPSGWPNADNDIKAIRTRSGHTLEFNDKDGSETITLTDKNGNSMVFDTSAKSITISAPSEINLSSKVININASDKVNIDGSNNVEVTSKDIKATGTTKVEIKSDTKVDVSAPTTGVKGDMSLKLESNGTTDINGSMMTNVKGGMLNLN